jgi:hypothetical protein
MRMTFRAYEKSRTWAITTVQRVVSSRTKRVLGPHEVGKRVEESRDGSGGTPFFKSAAQLITLGAPSFAHSAKGGIARFSTR